MSSILAISDYHEFSNEFSVISSVDKVTGANIGAVWRDILSLGDETSSKVKGFLSRGNNVYALVSDRYEDSFNVIDWVKERLSFTPKVSLSPLNYTLVFGTGTLPRSSEEVLSEIRSVRGTSNVYRQPTNVDSITSIEATSVLSEEYFILHADGISFEVFDEGTEYLLGRSPQSDFVVTDTGVSANHCKFRNTNNILQVMDLGSTNGTKVNGKRIKPRSWTVLGEKDTLKIGRVIFKIYSEGN